jgi:hypothetical protein
MKKFSNITNQTVGKEPVVKGRWIIAFKSKVLNLLEQYLSVAHYGPTDRYYQAGTIKISGQELFTRALLSFWMKRQLRHRLNY